MRFSERLKVAQNIIARGGIEGIDLYAELARSEALMNGISAEMDMMGENNAPISPVEPSGGTIMPQEGQSTTQGEITPPMA
jgi:hypothetical protein